MKALAIRDLSVSYGDVRVTEGIGFEVDEGECFALVGESGSGKSTVLRAISGLAREWTGTIEAFGSPRRPGIDRSFARRCQMVFQDPYASLHPRKTVDATLAEPFVVHGIGDQDRRIVAALEAVGLDRRYRFRYPHQLSGGQRQRVAIARALVLEPRLLLLDEPTSALDASVQAEVLNLLEDLRRRRGLTFLMVSHDLAVVTHMCSRLAVMQKGRIVETLSAEDLAARRVATDYTRALMTASEGFRRPG